MFFIKVEKVFQTMHPFMNDNIYQLIKPIYIIRIREKIGWEEHYNQAIPNDND